MRACVRLDRPQRLARTARQIPRAVAVSRSITRSRPPAVMRSFSLAPRPALPPTGFQTDPYVDYGRFLTPEGGILMVYKDLDLRLRFILWRIVAWAAWTAFEGWLLYTHSIVYSAWANCGCFIGIAVVNFLILRRPPEIYRSVEIRPDCMILEGGDVFWLARMENGWPAFQPDEKNNLILSGIYGTRFVQYLTVRRFDDEDRMADVFAAHLQEAMDQLWKDGLPRVDNQFSL